MHRTATFSEGQQNSLSAPRNGRISAGNLCCTVSQERFLARKMRIRTMSIVPILFLGVEYCATFQAALYIETHSLMHQSEFHATSVALSRAADKRKSLINIHNKAPKVQMPRCSSMYASMQLADHAYDSTCACSRSMEASQQYHGSKQAAELWKHASSRTCKQQNYGSMQSAEPW